MKSSVVLPLGTAELDSPVSVQTLGPGARERERWPRETTTTIPLALVQLSAAAGVVPSLPPVGTMPSTSSSSFGMKAYRAAFPRLEVNGSLRRGHVALKPCGAKGAAKATLLRQSVGSSKNLSSEDQRGVHSTSVSLFSDGSVASHESPKRASSTHNKSLHPLGPAPLLVWGDRRRKASHHVHRGANRSGIYPNDPIAMDHESLHVNITNVTPTAVQLSTGPQASITTQRVPRGGSSSSSGSRNLPHFWLPVVSWDRAPISPHDMSRRSMAASLWTFVMGTGAVSGALLLLAGVLNICSQPPATPPQPVAPNQGVLATSSAWQAPGEHESSGWSLSSLASFSSYASNLSPSTLTSISALSPLSSLSQLSGLSSMISAVDDAVSVESACDPTCTGNSAPSCA